MKHLLFAALTLSFVSACSHDDANSPKKKLTAAQLVPDASETNFSSQKILPPGDPLGESLSQRPECLDQNGSGHKIVDPRLTPGSVFSFTTTVSRSKDSVRPDEQTFKLYKEDHTVVSNTGSSFIKTDVLHMNGEDTTETIQCALPEEGPGNFLNCPRNSAFQTKHSTETQQMCHLRTAVGEETTKPVKEVGPWKIGSGLVVNSIRETTTKTGSVICRVFDGNNKPREIVEGPGHTVEVRVYSFDVPNISKDSCFAGQVYFHYELRDGTNNVLDSREMNLEKYNSGKAQTMAAQTSFTD